MASPFQVYDLTPKIKKISHVRDWQSTPLEWLSITRDLDLGSGHIFLLSQLTTLTIQNSVPLSLLAQDLPFSQIFPTIVSLLASGLTPWLYDWSVSSEQLCFYF